MHLTISLRDKYDAEVVIQALNEQHNALVDAEEDEKAEIVVHAADELAEQLWGNTER
jgi:hypothetical protein